MVCFVCKFIDNVEFLLEDGSCLDMDFLCCVLEVVIVEGVMMINIVDMVGYGVLEFYGNFVKMLCECILNLDKVIFLVYCYNDFGMVVVNLFVGVKIGGVC